MATPPRIAVLGTGIMGMAMARNLRKAGLPVRVWNRSADRARPIVEVGGTLGETVAYMFDRLGQIQYPADKASADVNGVLIH